MALLPYVDESKASDKTREILGNTPRKMNVARMIANSSDAVFQNFSRLGHSLLTRAKLDSKLREIAILRTAKDCRSIYEWTQHVPAAKHVGVTDEQIAAIEKWTEVSCFSEVERLVLQLTDEVNANVKGRRETVEALKQHLSPGEIIELLVIIGHWRQTASVLETLEVDLEEFAGKLNILEGTLRQSK